MSAPCWDWSGVAFVGAWDDGDEIEAFIRRVGEIHEREERTRVREAETLPPEPAA